MGAPCHHIPSMPETPPQPIILASALRRARRARRISIATLAAEAGVSPRLVSEFEQGKRPNVSLHTALSLLALVGVSLRLSNAVAPVDADQAMAERASHRRATWTGSLTVLGQQSEPVAPKSAAARIGAVARASALAGALNRAPRTLR